MKTVITATVILVLFAAVPGSFAEGPGLTILYSGGVNGWFSGVKG